MSQQFQHVIKQRTEQEIIQIHHHNKHVSETWSTVNTTDPVLLKTKWTNDSQHQNRTPVSPIRVDATASHLFWTETKRLLLLVVWSNYKTTEGQVYIRWSVFKDYGAFISQWRFKLGNGWNIYYRHKAVPVCLKVNTDISWCYMNVELRHMDTSCSVSSS